MENKEIFIDKIFHDMGNIASYFTLYRDILDDGIEELSKDKVLELIDHFLVIFNIMKYSFNNFINYSNYKNDIYDYFKIRRTNIDLSIDLDVNEHDNVVIITNILIFCIKNKGFSKIEISEKKDNCIKINLENLSKEKSKLYMDLCNNKSTNENAIFLHKFINENNIKKTIKLINNSIVF